MLHPQTSHQLRHSATSLLHISIPSGIMSAKSVSRLGFSAFRRSLRSVRPQPQPNGFTPATAITSRLQPVYTAQATGYRAFHASRKLNTNVLSGTDVPKESEPSERPTVPTDISTAEYNQHADEFLDSLLAKIEKMQETRPEIDIEYSVRNRYLWNSRSLR